MDGARRAGTRGIEVRLLGPIEADREGRPVALGGPKPRALLAMLALDPGHVVSVDQLVEALWPSDPPETASHAVQVYVSQLRKALGPAIATRAPGYVLELDAEGVDVGRFRRLAADGRVALDAGEAEAAEVALREALALWRGPALADFAYEPFAQTDIARLEDLRAAVLEERIEADLALGRHAVLVSELEALVQAEPHRERPRAQLMLALYRSGRQADALAAYRAARDALVDELGIEPGPALKELEAAILRQDESLLLETTSATPSMQFRRLATILFVDVVESMALGEALDAEALGSVQRRYFETVSVAITRHGGTVEKYAGDAVMAAFGVPVSHEDDALRAARAAFDINAGIQSLNDQLARDLGVSLEIRIGIAAGEVVSTSAEGGQRFVAGDPVGIAARLQHEAGPGEIVVGEVVARLIDHAARLERRGALEIPGRRKPFATFLLHEVALAAPAFEQRLDAKLVGRKGELAVLRLALKRAVDGGSAQVVVVVGPPGVGKSRLASEFARRAQGVTTLRGRCLSYGEGITYWPLREVVEQSREIAERDAVLAALEADPPLPASEVGLLFRQLLEAQARARPLVLVLDDIHWAEPTFLELVEQLAGRAEGPILVVCLAREELLEEHPSFLGDRDDVERLELDALSAEEADSLVEGLGGDVLESDQRARIVEAAEGNPFFIEQLLAVALEGGLADQVLPETVRALLAARLDRLGPGERAVLERGAVIGKEFGLEDVTALLEPEAAPTIGAHVETLVARGFLRPQAEGELAFRHALAQEAVYRAAPKRLRAELHERFIERFEGRSQRVADLDEFAGYHLEQAYRLRTELGESDHRTEQLARDAARRLGAAGVRASKRADAHASIALFRRATALPALSPTVECELLCELGIALRAAGDLEGAVSALDRALEIARTIGDEKAEARARMERAYVLITFNSETGDALLDATASAIPVFEAAGDERLLGRAWLLAGWVHGGHRGRSQLRLEAAERALRHYRRSTWPVSTPIGEIANALYLGPTPVPQAIEGCEALLHADGLDRYGRANVEVYIGGLVAQTGAFDRARALLSSAASAYEDLGQRTSAATFSSAIAGEVELLAGDVAGAVEHLRWLCDELESTHAYSHLASAAGALAAALYRLDVVDEALEWTHLAERHAASDDLDALVIWMPVRAKILARRGNCSEAVRLGAEAVRLAETTDTLNRHAQALRDLGDVYSLAGSSDATGESYRAALELYLAKGNVVEAARTQSLLEVAVA